MYTKLELISFTRFTERHIDINCFLSFFAVSHYFTDKKRLGESILNSVDPGSAAHDQLPHMIPHCFPFGL